MATSLNNLADLYEAMGRYAEAEPLYKRSLEISEKRLGRDHPDVATSLNNLAALYRTMGRYAEAEPLYQRSLEICEKQLGQGPPRRGHQPEQPGDPVPGHGPIRQGRAALPAQPGDQGEGAGGGPPRRGRQPQQPGALSARPGRWNEAAQSTDREHRVVRRHVARVLPPVEKEQLVFLKATDERQLHGAVSLALARRDDPDAVARSAGWVLNGKAVAQEALAQRALLARDRDDPAAARR